jgi:LysR family nitrogen assimilation transcriptional regulator
LAKAIQIRASRISVRVVENLSETLSSMLVNGDLDIALTFSSDHPPTVISEHIYNQSLSLLSPKGTLNIPIASIHFDEATTLPLVLGSPNHTIRKVMLETALRRSQSLNVVQEVDSPQAAIMMVKERLGHTVLPGSLINSSDDSDLIEVREIIEPRLVRDLCLIRPAQHAPSTAVTFVRSELLDLLSSFDK